MKILKKIPAFIVIAFFIFFLIQTSLPVSSQEKNNSIFSSLLSEPYLELSAETKIKAPLSVEGPINIISQDNLGELRTANLTRNQSYLFPNLSGEVCLSAGNCLFSTEGTANRLVKFGIEGMADSSVQDFSQSVSITIDNIGMVGIGTENPENSLHVAGNIYANEDICTGLQGGICLSQLERASDAGTGTQERVTIDGEGTNERIPLWQGNSYLGNSEIYQVERNIGIGMAPSYKLDVAGTLRVLGFRLPVSPEVGYGLLSDEKGFGSWQPVLTPRTSGGDIAENFPFEPNCKKLNNCPKPGDLVSINENKFIEKSSTPYDKKIIGVISTEPAMTLRGDLTPLESQPVALIGRIPTKVSLENGSIEIGDLLTSSFIPGVAKRATEKGRVVGVALDSFSKNDLKECNNKKVFDCQKEIGKIDTLINLSNIY